MEHRHKDTDEADVRTSESWICTNSEINQNVLPLLPGDGREKSLINDCDQSLIQMNQFKWHHLHLT